MPSAKEVEQFAYCAHNWFLARHGVDGAGVASRDGIAGHRELGAKQARVDRDARESRYALQAALSIILLALSGVLAAIALRLSGRVEISSLVVVAIVLGLGSSGLLTLSLFAQRDAHRRTLEAGLVPGRVVASDLAGEAPLLVDSQWDLAGRPDYILRTKSGQVPVEVKTGKTPERPHHSHRMQVACYLRLLQAGGQAPEYGLLSYPKGVFRVDWSDDLERELRGLLDRMAAARKAGKADRDHEQPSRCRGCARREACQQRLA